MNRESFKLVCSGIYLSSTCIAVPTIAQAFPNPAEVSEWLIDSNTYYERLESMVALGAAALLPLGEWIDDPQTSVEARRFVVAAAAGIGNEKAVPLLSRIAWDDPEPQIRNSAASVLVSMPFEGVKSFVLAALRHSEHSPLALMALQTRRVHGADGELSVLLGGSDTQRRRLAAGALLVQETPSALHTLARLSGDSDPHIRGYSVLARLIMGHPFEPELTSIWRPLSESETQPALQLLDLARFGVQFVQFLTVLCTKYPEYLQDSQTELVFRILRDLAFRRPDAITHPSVEPFVIKTLAALSERNANIPSSNTGSLTDSGVIIRAYGVERMYDLLHFEFASNSVPSRLFSMEMCGFGDGSKTLALLQQGIDDSNVDVRLRSFRMIAYRASKKEGAAVDLLKDALSNEQPAFEAVVAGMESNQRSLRELAAPWVAFYLEVDNGLVDRTVLLKAIARRPWTSSVRNAVHALLRTCKDRLCFDVVDIIAETHDSESAAVLLAFAQRVSGMLRAEVIRCLGELGTTEVAPFLVEILSNVGDPNRTEAFAALGRLPSDSFCGTLMEQVERVTSGRARRGLARWVGKCAADESFVKRLRAELSNPHATEALLAARALYYTHRLRKEDIELIGDRLTSFDVRNLTTALELLSDVSPQHTETVWRVVEPIRAELVATHPDLTKSILSRCCSFFAVSNHLAFVSNIERCGSVYPIDQGDLAARLMHGEIGEVALDCTSAPDVTLARICRQAERLRVEKKSTVGMWVNAARSWDLDVRNWAEKRLHQDAESYDIGALCDLLRLDHPMNPEDAMREVLARYGGICPDVVQ